MSLLDMFAAQAAPVSSPLVQVPSTPGERFTAEREAADLSGSWWNLAGTRRDGYQLSIDALHKATGTAYPNPYGAVTAEEMTRLGNQPAIVADRRQKIVDAHRTLMQESGVSADIPNPELIDQQIGERDRAVLARAASLVNTGNGLAAFAGGMTAANPVNIVGFLIPPARAVFGALPVARGFISQVAGEAAYQGVTQGALTAGSEVLERVARTETGSAPTLSESAATVTMGTAAGAVLGGGFRAAHLGTKALWERWNRLPEAVKENAPLEVRDAFKVIELDTIYGEANRLGLPWALHERYQGAAADPVLRGMAVRLEDLRPADTPMTALATILRQVPAETPGGATFSTAKGSTYEVHGDGTTTRNKSFHPEHGAADQGMQPRSEATFYVSPDDTQKLGEFQTQGSKKAVVQMQDGRWGVAYLEGPNAGKVERRTAVAVQTEPAVGLVPVEVWKGGQVVHFGNQIVSVGSSRRPSVNVEGLQRAAARVGVLPDAELEPFARQVRPELFSRIEGIDRELEALRQVPAETAPPAGMTRLYRIEPDAGQPGARQDISGLSEWSRQAFIDSGAYDATGRWFAMDKETLDFYREDNGHGGAPVRMVHIDVPTSDVEKYRVSNQTGKVRDVSGRPEEEFFVPRDVANTAQRTTLPIRPEEAGRVTPNRAAKLDQERVALQAEVDQIIKDLRANLGKIETGETPAVSRETLGGEPADIAKALEAAEFDRMIRTVGDNTPAAVKGQERTNAAKSVLTDDGIAPEQVQAIKAAADAVMEGKSGLGDYKRVARRELEAVDQELSDARAAQACVNNGGGIP